MENKEECEKLFEIAYNRAIVSFKHFLSLLDIDPELLSNLYETKVEIDYDSKHVKDDECALTLLGNKYDDAVIYIGKKYMDDLIDDLLNGKNRQEIINSLSSSIVHELLHVNRSVIIDNELNSDDLLYLDSLQKNEDSILNNNHKIDISLFDKLLDDSISNGFYNYFDDYVPLKIRDNGNGLYDIVAYSKKQNSYVFYYDQVIGSVYGNSSTMLSIGLELNSESFKHDYSYIIFLDKDINNDRVRDPADYLHEKEEKINKYDKINYQISFEETLVEVLSLIIINTRKDKELNLNNLNNYFNDIDICEEIIAYVILKRMGMNTLKWFMLSTKEDYYDDKFNKIFKEKYNLLIKLFNELRKNTSNYEDYNDETIDKLIDIVNEKIPKR